MILTINWFIASYKYFQLPPIMNIERNSSGHIIKMSGVAQFALDLLVEKLHFTYTIN